MPFFCQNPQLIAHIFRLCIVVKQRSFRAKIKVPNTVFHAITFGKTRKPIKCIFLFVMVDIHWIVTIFQTKIKTILLIMNKKRDEFLERLHRGTRSWHGGPQRKII